MREHLHKGQEGNMHRCYSLLFVTHSELLCCFQHCMEAHARQQHQERSFDGFILMLPSTIKDLLIVLLK